MATLAKDVQSNNNYSKNSMTFHYLETLIDFVVEMMHSNSTTASLFLMINDFVHSLAETVL